MSQMDRSLNLTDAEFSKLQSIIHKETGITIGDARKMLLVSRLRSRLREVKAPNFKEYLVMIASDRAEMQELINRIVTNETYFYRTPRIWSHFRDTCVQDFIAKDSRRPMRVWSAAASTGEEAHTMGVVLEGVRRSNKGFDYTVVGTDVSSRVIAVCEEGLYNGRSIARFRSEDLKLFNEHMHGTDEDGYKVSGEIKKRIKFRLHNLMKPLTREQKFDVVFLRNVLIYFSVEDQLTILRHVHKCMEPDGTLIIGESESLGQMETDFENIAPLIYKPAT